MKIFQFFMGFEIPVLERVDNTSRKGVFFIVRDGEIDTQIGSLESSELRDFDGASHENKYYSENYADQFTMEDELRRARWNRYHGLHGIVAHLMGDQ